MLLHPITWSGSLPSRLNNPFNYEAHPLCREAFHRVCTLPLFTTPGVWKTEVEAGKMFGILIVRTLPEQGGSLAYLTAFSGQIGGKAKWPGFVPPVFDYLQPQGYFKTHEAEITRINMAIARLEQGSTLAEAEKALDLFDTDARQRIDHYRAMMAQAKLHRDERRAQGSLSAEEEEAMRNESRFHKAELRRLRTAFASARQPLIARMEAFREELNALRKLRKQLSDELQDWLFMQFCFRNVKGEVASLNDIFAQTAQRTPPAGTGECCAPKLLHYAFTQGLQPVVMAEFWYGASPKAVIRRHGEAYPACKSKCLPLLTWMLQLPEGVGNRSIAKKVWTIPVLFEDEHLLVAVKPSGLPTVPGKDTSESLQEQLQCRYTPHTLLYIVHRLDMDTSGLLVMAKSATIQKALQAEFAARRVKKRYIALLDGTHSLPKSGEISLPLAPDYDHRPCQQVDELHGKPALTHYETVGVEGPYTRIRLFPVTGRTHQLRVHCAHIQGLGMPIVGDTLYGRPSTRLMLHAEQLTFIHPITGRKLTFSRPAPF